MDNSGRPTPLSRAPAPITAGQPTIASRTVGRFGVMDAEDVVVTATAASVAIGVSLRIWQYLSAPSLYWGEIALARNIDARSLGELLSAGTAFGQGASPGYLIVQELVVNAFGSSEMTHRFFPFLSSLLALMMFVRVASLYLTGTAKLLAVTCFSLGFPYLFITSPFKPLASVDTAATLAFFLIAYNLMKSEPSVRRSLIAGLAGIGLISVASATVVTTAGFALMLTGLAIAERNYSRLRRLVPALLMWAVAAAAVAWFDHQTTDAATRTVLRDLYAGAQPPSFPNVPGQARWLYNRLGESLGPVLFHFRLPLLALCTMALGFCVVVKRRRAHELLLVTPFLAALGASALGWYIFQGFYLSLVFPFLFIMFALGAELMRAQIERAATLVAKELYRVRASAVRAIAIRASRALGAVSMLGLVALPVTAFADFPPPYHVAEMKSVLARVRDSRLPGDAVYGIVTTSHAIAWYAPQFGFDPSDITVGACHIGEPRKTLVEIDQFRGRDRVWVMFTHDLAAFNIRAEMLNYLRTIGTLKDSVVVTPRHLPTFVLGASAYLFDLSDSTRLASMTAESIPLLRPRVSANNSGCGKGMLSADEP